MSVGREPNPPEAARRKLTPGDDLAIAVLYHAGGETYRSLAAKFGVSQATIHRHVNPEAAERYRQQSAAGKRANPERERENQRAWRERNPDYAWKARNPEAARAHDATRRARKHKAFVEVVSHGIVWERDGGICGVCHEPADRDDWHLDHVQALANGGEHSYANAQVSHPSCNLRKHAKPAPRPTAAT